LRRINGKALKIAEQFFWRESILNLQRLSLTPCPVERLLWNPLFESKIDVSKDQFMKLPKARKGDYKEVENVLKRMLRQIETDIQKEKENDLRTFEVVSGLIMRTISLESLPFEIKNDEDYQTFMLVDDIVSFCQFPYIRLRKHKRKIEKESCSINSQKKRALS